MFSLNTFKKKKKLLKICKQYTQSFDKFEQEKDNLKKQCSDNGK